MGGSSVTPPSREHRYMVEDIAVTPFFKRHGGHMPATIKLHGVIREDKNSVIFETKLTGYSEEDVKVTATTNTIDVDITLEKKAEGDVKFHNSYFTPTPIWPEKIRVEQKKGTLKVTAPKR